MKAYQNLRKLDDPGRFAPWLYRIAHNEAYSMFRKRRPETDVEEVAAGGYRNRNHRGRKLGLPHRIEPGGRQRAGPAVAGTARAVVLKIYQGFKFEEMAEILSCPVSTIKSRLYTALELLKTELAPIQARGVS